MRKIVTKEKVGKFLNRNMGTIVAVALVVVTICGTVYAGDADSMWTDIADTIKKWVTRLGGVVMFVGGVMFGLGWKNDDADAKTRGINTIVAGGIVTAVATITSSFFQ